MAKITIITVCFNVVNDIGATIESVVNQSYKDIEYIVIDGGSTDGTVNVVKGFLQHIDIFVSEPDNGIFYAMNKGLKFATGTWVNFMNAGDTFHNTSVLESVFSNTSLAEVGVLYGFTFSNGIVRKPYELNSIKYGGIMACHQSIFYNRLICGNELYYKTKHKFYGDIELTRRLFLKGIRFKEVSQVIACYQGGGISSEISTAARVAKFDYLFQNFGFRGLIYGLIGKIQSLFKKT